jgi:hypothetical protein
MNGCVKGLGGFVCVWCAAVGQEGINVVSNYWSWGICNVPQCGNYMSVTEELDCGGNIDRLIEVTQASARGLTSREKCQVAALGWLCGEVVDRQGPVPEQDPALVWVVMFPASMTS